MGQFVYKAKDGAGRVRTGTVEAVSKGDARRQLLRQRMKPLSVRAQKVGNGKSSKTEINFDEVTPIVGMYIYKDAKGIQINPMGEQSPSTKDLIVFTKQFSTMLNSGVPLIQALGLLAKQQRVMSFGRDLEKIRISVENGATLSEAMGEFPSIFDSLYVSMVRAGEASGNLDTILMKLVSYIEKAAKIKSQIKSAMTYPAIVILVAVGVIAGLLLFFVPTIAKQFTDNGQELPGLTQAVIDTSTFLSVNWHIIGGCAFIGFVLLKMYIKTERGRAWWDDLLLKIPGIGNLLKKVAVGRFCSTMSTMLTSGVNLLEALNICASSSGNKTIETFVIGVRSRIEGGEKMSDPLGDGGLFPPMVVSMVSVGEATGAMDEMLTKVSEFYEDEVDIAVKGLLAMIEPILIIGVGGIVGVIVIATYLPIFDMGNLVG